MTFSRYSFALVLLILLFVFPKVYSHVPTETTTPGETALINVFFRKLYDFSFREADSMVVVMKKTGMDNATLFNIEANLSWWKLLSGDSIDANLRNCGLFLDESIKLLMKKKREDMDANLNLIYSWSLKARLENYNRNTLKAVVCFYKSNTYIKKCISRQYKDEKFYMVLGLYLYFIDYIETEYYMMNALLFSFPPGDKIKGLNYLEECSDSGDEMISTETTYFLLKIYAYIEKDYQKAYEKALILNRHHPNNLVYDMELLKLLLLLNKTNEAQVFRTQLISQIKNADYINNSQKNHFITQLEQPGNTGF